MGSSVTETRAGGGGGHQKAGEPLSVKSPRRGWVLESKGLWFFIQEDEHRKRRDGWRRGSDSHREDVQVKEVSSD